MADAIEIDVQGMTCEGCVNSVKRALSRVPGVKTVDVDLAAGRASVTGPNERDALLTALQKAGYSGAIR
jgi:Cu+-exporting ATPase